MKSAIISGFLSMALATQVPSKRIISDYKDQVDAMPTKPAGFYHLGSDGIMRSISPDSSISGPGFEVLGAVPASPADIARDLAREDDEDFRELLRKQFEGVDGRDVDPRHLHMLPPEYHDPAFVRRLREPPVDLVSRRSYRRADQPAPGAVLSRETCPKKHKNCTNSECGDTQKCRCEVHALVNRSVEKRCKDN